MFPAETIVSFFIASLLLAATPGPDNIFVLTQSTLQGARAGLIVTTGLCTGLVAHTTAVAIGVAAIFHTSAFAYTALMLIGACYLSYLAWQSFRASAKKMVTGKNKPITLIKLYQRGIIMNITNPKVSLFFLAFLPFFADPSRGALSLQIMVLGMIFIIATVIVFGMVAIVAGSAGQWLNRSEKMHRVMNIIAGTVFAALAAGIIIQLR